MTSGTFGTEPRRGGSPPPGPPEPGGFRRGEERRLALARRGSGSFSGRGVIGPSGYSKPSLLLPASSVTTTTRTWPPDFEPAEQHLVGQRLLDVLLDHPRHRPGAHQLVIAVGDQPLRGLVGQLDGDVAVGELRLELQHELLDHHGDDFGRQMREGDDGVEPVAEFRREQSG